MRRSASSTAARTRCSASSSTSRRTCRGAATQPAGADDDADAPVEERIHNAILHRRKDGIEAKIDEALQTRDAGRRAQRRAAARDEGSRRQVRRGRADPAVRAAVGRSDEEGRRAPGAVPGEQEGYTKGKVVLATVFGDVHDIGKNLVNTILSNNGYTVLRPRQAGADEHDPRQGGRGQRRRDRALGAAGHHVASRCRSASGAGPRGLRFPVIVGGAAINRDFGRRIALSTTDERFFEPGVFYAKDAFEGLDIMDALTGDPARRDALARAREARSVRDCAEASARRRASTASGARFRAVEVASSPTFRRRRSGARARSTRRSIRASCGRASTCKSLYRLSWGAREHEGRRDWERLVREEFEPRLRRYEREARTRAASSNRASCTATFRRRAAATT